MNDVMIFGISLKKKLEIYGFSSNYRISLQLVKSTVLRVYNNLQGTNSMSGLLEIKRRHLTVTFCVYIFQRFFFVKKLLAYFLA
jgi:hypothetical protein